MTGWLSSTHPNCPPYYHARIGFKKLISRDCADYDPILKQGKMNDTTLLGENCRFLLIARKVKSATNQIEKRYYSFKIASVIDKHFIID